MSEVSGLDKYLNHSREILSADNYNEIDGLVFSQLSYIEFENVYNNYETKEVSVQAFAADALKTPGLQLSQDEVIFLQNIANSSRYRNCMLTNLAAENDSSQWAAMTININDNSNSSIIAMRGTNGTTLGWSEDIQLMYDVDGTEAQKLSAQYLENSTAQNIYLAGHSKGGNDVSSAYAMVSEEIRNKVIRIDNYDGPGVNKDFAQMYTEGYAELNDKLNNYYPKDSIIGQFLNDNPGNNYFIETTSRGSNQDKGILGEHDPFQWNVSGDLLFEETEQSFLSQKLDDVLDGTLDTLSQYERAQIVNFLEKIGLSKMISGNNTLLDNANALFCLRSLFQPENMYVNPIQKAIIHNLLLELLINRVEVGAQELINKLEQKIEHFCNTLIDVQKWFEDKIQTVAIQIATFRNEFIEGIQREWNSIKNWAKEKYEQIFNRNANCKSASYKVNVGMLTYEANNMKLYAGELQNIKEDIEDIQHNLSFVTKAFNTYNLTKVICSVSQEQRSCMKLSKTAEQVALTYDKYENTIINNVLV